MYVQKNIFLFKRLLFFLIILIDLISLGIILDSQGFLLETPFLGSQLVKVQQEWSIRNNVMLERYSIGNQRRGAFLIGGSTTVYPVLSIGFLANVLFFSGLKKANKKDLLLVITNYFIIWLGAFFSLSRTPLLLTTAMCFYALADRYSIGRLKNLGRQLIFIILIVCLVLAMPQIQLKLFQQIDVNAVTRFNLGFSEENHGNLIRYLMWQEGLKLFNDPDAWIGYGVGTSSLGARSYINSELSRSHYESALFSAFSEGGILGVLTLLLPYIVIIIVARQTPKSGVFIVWSCLIMINLFAAPISGYTTVLPCFIAMGLCLSFRRPKEVKIREL
jgi:hypothetical protein